MTTHTLKTINPYFNEVWNGRKTFEVRKNDRAFKTGDKIVLIEYIPETNLYTFREIRGQILYVLRDFEAINEEFVVFSFRINSRLS